MADIIVRGNTVSFAFTFYDAESVIVDATTAELELTYPGRDAWQTETLTLVESVANVWSGTWDSSFARPGWVEYHAHATAPAGDFAQDGRFKLRGNRAGLQHNLLPAGDNPLADTTPTDYA